MQNKRKKEYRIWAAVLAVCFITLCAAGNQTVSQGEDFQGNSPFISGNYTHAGVFDGYSVSHGIDVSKYQTNINWVDAKAAGVDFAFIRVGYRGYGESGTMSVDGYYAQNMKNAIAAGVKAGVYIYSQAITEDEAREEAQYILDRVNGTHPDYEPYDVSMPLVMDYEYASVNGSLGGRLYNAHLSREDATKVCMAFCDTISAAGYTPMVYASKSLLESDVNAEVISEKYPVWLAHYTTKTSYAGAYTFWQYTSSARVTWVNTALETGVGGGSNIDCNFWYYKEGEGFLTGNTTASSSPSPSGEPLDISGCKVSGMESSYAYTGAKIKLAVTIKNGKTKLKENTDYTVSYTENKKIGTATVIITGMGAYEGTIVKNFKIVPPEPENVSEYAKTASSITLQWDKVPKCSGYIIFRASGDGDYKKAATIKSRKTTKWTDKKLAKKTKYSYIVQCYQQIGTTKYKSDYSEEVTIKTLKK